MVFGLHTRRRSCDGCHCKLSFFYTHLTKYYLNSAGHTFLIFPTTNGQASADTDKIHDTERLLPVALLSSVACELAPLRIVLLCVFLYLFFYFFLLLFWYVYRLQWLCTTEEHFWTLDIATLTWLRILINGPQRGHWRYLRSTELNNDHLNKPQEAKENTAGDVAGIRNRLRKRLTALLCRVFCSLMSQSWENKMDDS